MNSIGYNLQTKTFSPIQKPLKVDINKVRSLTEPTNKPVEFQEGINIVFNGMKQKATNILTSIVRHPVKTAASVGITVGALAALSLINIPMITSGAILALGFAGIAVAKTFIDGTKAFKHHQQGNNDALRTDLHHIGGDSVDLMLSLPFVPKSIQAVKDQVRFGRAIGLNHELLSGLSSAKGLINKAKVFINANKSLNEEILFNKSLHNLEVPANIKQYYNDFKKLEGEKFARACYERLKTDLGFKNAAPELMIDPELAGSNTMGQYNPYSGKLTLNPTVLESKAKAEMLNFMRHELEHYRQFADIARTEGIGIEGLAKATTDKYINDLKTGNTALFDLNRTVAKNHPEKLPEFAEKLYKSRVEELGSVELYKTYAAQNGVIPAESELANKVSQYVEAYANYPDMSFSFLAPPEAYHANILEVEAFSAGNAARDAYKLVNEAGTAATETAKTSIYSVPAINSARSISLTENAEKQWII